MEKPRIPKKVMVVFCGLMVFFFVFSGLPIKFAQALCPLMARNVSAESKFAWFGNALDRVIFVPTALAGGCMGAGGVPHNSGNTNTPQPPTDPCANNDPKDSCPHFFWGGRSWGTSQTGALTIKYKIDAQRLPSYITLADFKTAVSTVLGAWATASGNKLAFQDDGMCNNCLSNAFADGNNVIGFWPLANAGKTYQYPPSAVWENDGYGKSILKNTDVDIALDSDLTDEYNYDNILCDTQKDECKWKIVGEGTVIGKNFDLKGVLAHEVGHMLGLGELTSVGESKLTMYQSPALTWYSGQTFRQSLQTGDTKGAHCIYSESESDTCKVGSNNLLTVQN